MEDRCICCGEIVPEGRQVCGKCEASEVKREMQFAYNPSIFLNSTVEYVVHYTYEYREKPDMKITTPKELRAFLQSHSDYDIVDLTPMGFYKMEMGIARREVLGE